MIIKKEIHGGWIMRKVILFGVIFFLVDRFMHYKLTHNFVKSRIIADSKLQVLLSEKRNLSSDANKKTFLVQNKNRNPYAILSHSSNRNV